ncbi:MAG: hypothetical protein GXY85_06325 [Candidatus Brocadiaceae bacterium]|nr:hypothetical protein [Candidatus Brocadiaceae bacterium]
MRQGIHSAHTGRRGTVLIVTMWIVLVIAGLVLVFGRTVRVEAVAAANQVAALQAEAVARGALAFAMAKAAEAAASAGAEGSEDAASESEVEAVQVGDGYFWLLHAHPNDNNVRRYGMTDEAAKVNLNTATAEMLLKLPEMTAELAAAIIDWRDADDEISPGGAESEYYLLLDDAYYCKNGPFETVDELLLVAEATPELLYGADLNLNGIIDPHEEVAGERGFYDFLTVFSAEPNTSESGEDRVNVNTVGSEAVSGLLRDALSEDRYFAVMDLVRSGRPFDNVLEFYTHTGLTPDEFATIADRIVTSDEQVRRGLVNVNTAPREVLACLPQLDEGDVDALLAGRTGTQVDRTNLAWVAEALPPEKAAAIGGHITTRGYQRTVDVVAVSGDGRAYRRFRAIIDVRGDEPRVLTWFDLTHLGWPLEPEILEGLRRGSGLEKTATMIGDR